MSIQIQKTILNQMLAHAKALLPIECCGYLAGDGQTITTLYDMTNVDNSPEHFSFDPKEQFAVVKEARNNGLTLMGVYHSHPESPARLSEEDLRLLNDPNMVYFIVSLLTKEGDIKAYKINKTDESIEVISVEIIKI
jgi:proteasome lid subunit RPN8/RPN11